MAAPSDGVPIKVTAYVAPAGDSLAGAGGPPHASGSRRPFQISDRMIVVRNEDDEERPYRLDSVLEPETVESGLYDAALSGPVLACAEGISGAVIVVGPASSGRSDIFSDVEEEGADTATGGNGIVAQAAGGLFNAIRRKSKAINGGERSREPRYSAEVFMSLVEVFDENIQDLLDVSKRGLGIREDDRDGVFIMGATTYGPIPNVVAFLDLFKTCDEVRSRIPTDFGPRALYSSVILRITLIQTMTEASVAGHPIVEELRSTLYIADIAGAEKLAEEGELLISREGPTLNRGILSLRATAAALRSQMSHHAMPHRDSLLTHALQEPLGGNCVTSVVAIVQRGENRSADAVLALCSAIGAGKCFPVVNGVAARGLLQRYRSELRYLKDLLKDARAGVASNESKVKEESTAAAIRAGDLQGQVLRMELEKFKLLEEKDHLVRTMKELRDKYNELVDSKVKAQTDLIAAEEEKLAISKGLLDLQIENARLQELVDQDEYESNAKVIAAESTVLEAEMKFAAANERCSELQTKLEVVEVELKDLQEEMVSLKANYMSRTKELRAEQSKSQDLGAEVLTLVNRIAVLEERMRNGGAEIPPSVARPALDPNPATQSERLTHLEAKLAATEEKLETAESDVRTMSKRLKQAANTHRENLKKVWSEPGVDKAVAAALDELADAYSMEESRIFQKLSSALSEVDALSVRNRQLVDRCGELRHRVANLTPDQSERKLMEANVGEMDLAVSADPLQDTLYSLRQQLRDKTAQVVAEKERAARAVLEQEQAVKAAKGARAGAGTRVAAEHEEELDALRGEIRSLKAEQRQLRSQLAAAESRPYSRGSISETLGSARDRGSASEMRDKLSALTREYESAKHEARKAGETSEELKEENAKLREQLAKAQSSAPAAAIDPMASEDTLLGQLQRAEQRAADLLGRNTVLETELANYKTYMAQTLPQIAKLKKEVKAWKKKAGGGD